MSNGVGSLIVSVPSNLCRGGNGNVWSFGTDGLYGSVLDKAVDFSGTVRGTDWHSYDVVPLEVRGRLEIMVSVFYFI